MKKMLLAVFLLLLQYLLGFVADVLLGYEILLPTGFIGVAYLVLWGVFSGWSYSGKEGVLQHMLQLSTPVVVLFTLYIPFVNIFQNLPLFYLAPAFSIVVPFVARLGLGIYEVPIVIVASLLMIGVAFFGVWMKQHQSANAAISETE